MSAGPGQGTTAATDRLTPAKVFDLMLAYKNTALLRTGIELGVFDCLAAGAAGAEEVAGKLDLDQRGARLLLKALAAIGLLGSDGSAFWLDADAAGLLVRGRPGYVGDMVKVMSSHWEWDALGRLSEAVRAGHTVMDEHAETPGYAYWEDFAAFAGAVAGPAAKRVTELLEPWAAARDRLHVLDVACGHGLYGYTIARHHAGARVWSLDWPNVLPLALEHAERLGVAERVETIPGDMFSVPLGGPYDAVLITNVLHHFDEDRAAALVRRAAEATVPGGRIVIVGFTVDDGPPAADPSPHLFSILMLVWTRRGEVHPTAAYERMLVAAGFENMAVHRVSALPLRIIVADRAAG